jgi:hypothetical protein
MKIFGPEREEVTATENGVLHGKKTLRKETIWTT